MSLAVDGPTQPHPRAARPRESWLGAVSVAIGFGLSHLALRPVRQIRETASRIGANNLSERITVPSGNDEISQLALLLNAMFDRLEASFKHVRRFAADAAHELRTPLTVLRTGLEVALRRPRQQPAPIQGNLLQANLRC